MEEEFAAPEIYRHLASPPPSAAVVAASSRPIVLDFEHDKRKLRKNMAEFTTPTLFPKTICPQHDDGALRAHS
jgi:hypothetical protein